MAKKGSYNAPGIPALWDECKIRISVGVTPTARDSLDELAKKYGVSRSELIERIARGLIPLGEDLTNTPSDESSSKFAA